MNQSKKLGKWRSLIAEQKESGQSVAAFCRTRGVREALYYYWKKQLQELARPQFVEVQVAKADLSQRCSLGSTIEVRLGNGRSLIVPPEFNASLAGVVVGAGVRVMISLPSLHTLDRPQAARIWLPQRSKPHTSNCPR